MKKQLMSILNLAMIIAMLFTFATAEINAQQGPKSEPENRNFLKIKERLQLTDEQITNVRPILVEHLKQLKEIRSKYQKDGKFDRLGYWNEVDQLHKNVDSKLEQYLTKQQMEELQKMRAENRQNFGTKAEKRKKGQWKK